MDKRLKWGLIIGGSALIVGASLFRGSGQPDPETNPDVLDARVQMNNAAMKLRAVQMETSADIVMNRDKVTGATSITALETLGGVIAGGQALSASLNENFTGIVNNRISSATAMALEATRASVQKYAIKKQYKLAKKGQSFDFASNIIGTVGKLAASFF